MRIQAKTLWRIGQCVYSGSVRCLGSNSEPFNKLGGEHFGAQKGPGTREDSPSSLPVIALGENGTAGSQIREFRRQFNPTKASKLIPSMSNELGSGVATVAVNVEVPADFRLNVP
jgi:hypothetical protein